MERREDQAADSGGSRPSRDAESNSVIPPKVLNTWDLELEESRSLWREVIDGTYILDDAVPALGGHRVDSQVWLANDLLFSTFRAEANSVFRTQKLVRTNPGHLVKVRIYRQGHMRLIGDEQSGTLGTGAVHFIDHDRAQQQVSTDHEQLSIFVPYHLLGYDPSRHPAWFSIGLDTPAGRLIETSVLSVFGEIGHSTQQERESLAAGLIGLLRGVLAGALDSGDDNAVQSTRLAAMQRFIDSNLQNPKLGPDMLLSAFAVSRTTLYRDFADFGGVLSFILERRMHRAYRMLAESAPTRGVVQAVGERVGFESTSHFSRSFRKAFGAPPGTVVGQWASPAEAANQGTSTTTSTPRIDPVTDMLRWAYHRYR